MNRRALVTGGAGFIGSVLVRQLLQNGWQVRVLDNLATGRESQLPEQADLLIGDVRDELACRRACQGADIIFHLAARVTVRQSVTEFVEDADVNLLGTLRLLRAAGSCGVRRFLLASSMAVYDEGTPNAPIREDHPTRPRSPYGLAKLSAEQYLMMMGPTLGIEPVVLRFFNTYGPNQSYTPYVGVLTIFVTRWLAGESCTIFGDGNQERDFVHVEDVAEACRLAASAEGIAGLIFNVGSGVGLTVNALAHAIRQHLPGTLQHAKAHPAELRYSVADITLAKTILGYQPRHRLIDDLPEIIDQIRRRNEPADDHGQ